jgi:hypothetical protein
MTKGAYPAPFEHENAPSEGRGRYFLTVFLTVSFLTVSVFLAGAAFS